MASFGPTLQRERQLRGVSIDDVARDTRVARRYLIALENETISTLPGGAYNRAYLRTYAEYLGLDADRLVQDYDRTAQEKSDSGELAAEPDALATMRVAARSRDPEAAGLPAILRTAALGGAVLAALAAAIWFGWPYVTGRGEIAPAGVSGSPEPTAPPEPQATVDPVAPPSEPPPPVPPRQTEPEAVTRGTTAAPPEAVPAEPAPARPAPNDRVRATELSVDRAAVGTDIVNRQLVGRSETFPVGTRVVFWTLVTGGTAGDTLRHVWIHQGRVVTTVALRIGNAHWRTYSRRTLAPGSEGDWVVEARDARGHVLARRAFRCEPRRPSGP